MISRPARAAAGGPASIVMI